MVKRSVAALLIVALLCALFMQPDWQAAGNMTSELPLIRMYMDAGIEAGLVDEPLAENISDSCNAQWDQFWNVGVVKLGWDQSDAVIYGYAFRSHWYWHNNYGPNRQSFLIWKDYNCILRQSKLQTFTTTNSNDLALPVINGHASNIWDWTKNAMDLYQQVVATSLAAGQEDKVAVTGLFVNEVHARVAVRVCCQQINKLATGHPSSVLAVVFVMRVDPPGP